VKNDNGQYRHEYKYICSEAQLALAKERIEHLMPLDSHVGDTGKYIIRSLYFDDMYNSCFFENEDGVDQREKFRIRIYNSSSDIIRLELKSKKSGKTLKKSCALSPEQCRTLMHGIPPDISPDSPYLLQKLCASIRTRLMIPKVIVEYERVPFVYPLGNVRITFDKNIKSSADIENFLSKDISARPVMPTGQHVLEVKYDRFLPDFISRHTQLEGLQFTSFSKYYLCMKYNLRGLSI